MKGSNNRKLLAVQPAASRSRRSGRRWLALAALGAALALAPVIAGALAQLAAPPHGDEGALDRPGHHDRPVQQESVAVEAPAAPGGAAAVAAADSIVQNGVQVGFAIGPAGGDAAVGQLAELRFTLTDAATGASLRPGQRPGVWVDAEKVSGGSAGGGTLSCEDKIRLYAKGAVGYRPDIDLNSYFVLAMNADATISVIDPVVGVTGFSQLYAMAFLQSPGEDWAMSADGKRLFVTMPKSGQVAVIDTGNFRVLKNIDVGANPVRIALQPDGQYIWVLNDGSEPGKTGVTVIDPEHLHVVARIGAGAGHHEIAFVPRNAGDAPARPAAGHSAGAHGRAAGEETRYAFVTSREAGTVSVIDTRDLKKVRDITVGRLPIALDVASANNTVYVANEADGTIVGLDGESHQITAQIATRPGIRALRFAPGGRWGVAVNARTARAEVLDVLSNRIVHTAEVGGDPDQVTFTSDFAYVRARGSTDVSIIDLSKAGQPESLPVMQIIGGQKTPGTSPARSVADAILPIHEGSGHVLIANPADQYIYFYMEGMKSPMGGFGTYGRTPRALQIVDRSLRETAPGAYAANVRLPQSGPYQVAFLLDEPRIVQCFSFTAAAAAGGENDAGAALHAELLNPEREAPAGTPVSLRFRLTDRRNGAPVAGLTDVTAAASLASGLWSDRGRAASLGEGVYEWTIPAPQPGTYTVLLAVPSRKLDFRQLPSFNFRVADRAAGG